MPPVTTSPLTPFQPTRLGDRFRTGAVHLFDHFYFMHVSEERYRVAEWYAQEVASISRGRKTRIFSEHSEVIGKLGEFIFRQYLQEYWRSGFTSYVEEINASGGDVTDVRLVGGTLTADVKARQLYTDQTIAPSFDLRVPDHELTQPNRYQEYYVLTAYCPATRYGYVFGWATHAEVRAAPIREDINCPSHCVPLCELHPIQELEPDARWRAAQAVGVIP